MAQFTIAPALNRVSGCLPSGELVVWGKYDRFISSKLGNEIAENLPNARLKVIDKAGHYVHMDKPQELAQVVTRFLDPLPK